MSTLKIITNYVPRPIIYGYELSPNERKEFDYMTDEELDDSAFFRYKGEIYSLGEFEHSNMSPFPKYWHGYHSDSYFSGILIHLCEDDSDYIVVGRYLS